MKESIIECIECIEESVLQLEQQGGGALLPEVLGRLGLRHLKLPSAQVISLFDMLEDGITPVTPELITSFLGICEAHKRLLFTMAGCIEQKAEKIKLDTAKREAEEKAAEIQETAEPAAPEQDAPTTQAVPSPQPAATQPAQGARGKDPGIFSIRVSTTKLDSLIDMVGKLMVTYAVIAQNSALDAGVSAALKELDTVIDHVRTEVENIRLVAMKQLFAPLHRLVNSLAPKIGKKVHFTVIGEELELDKTIVESLNEPLVHILRNAVDHGLESPEDRIASGKPETGEVTVKAWRKGESAYIEVKDDGKGLDPAKIRAKAIERGMLDPEAEISDEELYQYILKSGFSTAEAVTDISGRGVGMDAVVNAIKVQLYGEVFIKSELGKGTAFTIRVPLNQSMDEGIVEALIAKLGSETFIIPSRDVLEVYTPVPEDIVQLPDGRETVAVRGEIFGIIRLAEFFGLSVSSNGQGRTINEVIVVNCAGKKAAIVIDEVVNQQQVVVTNFTVPVQDIYSIPILGYGMMGGNDALVVDVEELLDSCVVDE